MDWFRFVMDSNLREEAMKCDAEMSTKPFNPTREEYLIWENKWLLGIVESWLILD